ncbi:MAG: peptidoglycan-binding protein, partial [Verrucomicrobia bacterium]|nr:peptidoglycan-binding protein [Verrucomicrobiota bacterium]
YQGNVNPGYRGNPNLDSRGNGNPDFRENGDPDAPYLPPASRFYPPPDQYTERDYDGFRRPYDSSIRVVTSRRALFAGTVYERAPVDVQESVLFAVQGELSKAGFYRAPITGEPGPATTDAIVHFQEAQELVVSGRLDSETLNELRALPGQRNGPPAGIYRGIPERVYRGIPVQ